MCQQIQQQQQCITTQTASKYIKYNVNHHKMHLKITIMVIF